MNKKIILFGFLMILLVGFVNGNVFNRIILQESANTTTYNITNFQIYFNYTKPINASFEKTYVYAKFSDTSSNWKNYQINESCWNYNQDWVMLAFYSRVCDSGCSDNHISGLQCYNGDYIFIKKHNVSSGGATGSSIVPTPIKAYNNNFNDYVGIWDDSGVGTISFMENLGGGGASARLYDINMYWVLNNTNLLYPTNTTSYYGDYNGSIILETNETANCYLNESAWIRQNSNQNTFFNWYNPDFFDYGNYSFSYQCIDTYNEINITKAYDLTRANDGTFTNYDFNHGLKVNSPDCSNGYCEFDGVSQRLEVGDGSQFNYSINDIFTINIWAKSNDITKNTYLIGKYDGDWYSIYENTNDLKFQIYSGGGDINFVINNVLSTGYWYFATLIYYGNTTACGYWNGGNKICQTVPTLGDFSTNSAKLWIGGLTGISYYNGSIDNVQIYNKALTSDEILAQYNAGRNSYPLTSDGLVLNMPMSEITQNTTHVYDINNYVNGYEGESARFDGVDKNIINNELDNTYFDKIHTFSAWIKPNNFNNVYQGIIGTSIAPNYNFIFRTTTGGNLQLRGWNGVAQTLQSTGTVTANIWNNVAVTIDLNANNVTFYINGNPSGSSTTTITSLNDGSAQDLIIGRYKDSSDRYFNGTIDNVRIWNRSLSQTEITEVYNNATYNPYNTLWDGLVLNMEFDVNDTYEGDWLEEDAWFLIDSNLTTSLVYPTNTTSYNTTWNQSIILNVSEPSGSVTCSLNDTRFSYYGYSNNLYEFRNNTFINSVGDIHISYTCNDSVNYYSNGSFWFNTANILIINIYDDNTGILINSSIDLTLYSADYYNSSFSTSNGTLIINGLLNSTYTAEFSSDNYSNREYVVSVGYGESTTLNAYLSITDGTAIFTTRDRETGGVISGAIITIKKYISGVLTTIYVKETDITGRIQFDYSNGKEYYFTVTKSGYDDKIFVLDPIIFSEYSVYLDSTSTIEDLTDFAGVSISHTPTLFYEGLNNLSITISSPKGTLLNYGFNITYLLNSIASNGSNAYGSSFDNSFNISGSTWGDMLHLTIYYTISGGEQKSFSYNYEIIPTPVNGTLLYNQDQTFGLGEFERVTLSTLLTLFVGGFVSIFGGAITGLASGLLIMGYFVKIGFISLWYAIIPIFAGAIILIWRSSQ